MQDDAANEAADRQGKRKRNLYTAALLALLAVLFAGWSLRGTAFHWLDATFGSRPLNAARSWHYHLTSLDLETILKSKADVVVTEYSANVAPFKIWSPAEVAQMKVRPGGGKRLVLSNFSIGEAEDYRFYWRPEWSKGPPPGWLVAENCAWPRNYKIRFWHDGWKDIIFRDADSFLKRIIAAGYDGIYLDRVDIFWEMEKERPTARDDMIQFVTEIAESARRLKPGFIVVAQNAEDLLTDPDYRDVIDGLGKEDLLYGQNGTNTRNSADAIRQSRNYIRKLQWDWKPVLSVEYVTKPDLIAAVGKEISGYGMVPTSAHRSLDGRPAHLERPPTSIKYGTPEWIAEKCKDKPHW